MHWCIMQDIIHYVSILVKVPLYQFTPIDFCLYSQTHHMNMLSWNEKKNANQPGSLVSANWSRVIIRATDFCLALSFNWRWHAFPRTSDMAEGRRDWMREALHVTASLYSLLKHLLEGQRGRVRRHVTDHEAFQTDSDEAPMCSTDNLDTVNMLWRCDSHSKGKGVNT